MSQAEPPLDVTNSLPWTPPVEHIAGNEKFVLKALEIQADHAVIVSGAAKSLVDITLDLEDGSPVGQEASLRELFVSILNDSKNRYKQLGVRIHAPNSPHFEADLKALSRVQASAYITIPKVCSTRDVLWAQGVFEAYANRPAPPFHVLIETPEAVQNVHAIAQLSCVQTLDFGLMDFISHLGGAVPSACMRSPGQFDHELLRRVKTEIALAASSLGKIASHNVTVDFRDPTRTLTDATRARNEFGFTRMWSIHPSQIDPILTAMLPTESELSEAREIINAARAAQWGPIEHNGRLHDRASYRYYHRVLECGATPSPRSPRRP